MGNKDIMEFLRTHTDADLMQMSIYELLALYLRLIQEEEERK